ncbi:hypothetical protein PAL_GLEAN10012665 [Pteropus alecto]|uniref:Uncharacterized protein n=1 Tax=Pteropus alecto TaxID=9402 RepID=L5K7P1_PTEAL|nr:hypothetical protein PAL_GLEAN10012665 [Pteropus alecto]
MPLNFCDQLLSDKEGCRRQGGGGSHRRQRTGPHLAGPPARAHACTRTHPPPIVVVQPVTGANKKQEFGVSNPLTDQFRAPADTSAAVYAGSVQ